jgi:uncharacterized protein (TIGR00369 family)
MKVPTNLDEWNLLGEHTLPGHMGIEILSVGPDQLQARMVVREAICAPNGFLHAASVVALADTACGYATIHNLPEGAQGFTTIEFAYWLKRSLKWDPVKEEIIGDPEANRWLDRPKRAPWRI